MSCRPRRRDPGSHWGEHVHLGALAFNRVVDVAAFALLVVAALGVAACGSDDKSSSTTGASSGSTATTAGAATTAGGAASTPAGGSAATPTGTPLKVMTVTTLNAAGPTYENIANTANAYAEYINKRGGIAGHPLEVIVCDEQFDAAVAATCARQAVDEGVVSVVGSFTFFAESIVPVIAASDITWFGACCPVTPSELTDKHSFNIGNQPMYAVGAVKKAVEDGCKKHQRGDHRRRPDLRGADEQRDVRLRHEVR